MMHDILKILGLSVLMILGFSGILIGCILLSIGRADDFMAALIALAGGIIVGPLCLYGIIKLNTQFQEKALETVLENPEQIVFRFPYTDDKKEVIITNQALFIGKRQHPFRSFYENLVALRQEGQTIIFDFEVTDGDSGVTRSRKIAVPTQLVAETKIWVETIQKQLTT